MNRPQSSKQHTSSLKNQKNFGENESQASSHTANSKSIQLRSKKKKSNQSSSILLRCFKYIYDPSHCKFCGLSFCSFLKFILFHICFYGFLIGLTIGILWYYVIYELKSYENIHHGHDSLFGENNIRLGFFPVNEKLRVSNLIRFEIGVNFSISSGPNYVQQLKNIVLAETKNKSDSYINCINVNSNWSQGHKLCRVYDTLGNGDLPDWGPCTPSNAFGFKNGQPCILLKLNRALLWTPQQITHNTNMKKFIVNELNYEESMMDKMIFNRTKSRSLHQKDRVICIRCKELSNSANNETIQIGTINYYPTSSENHPTGPCISSFYFPYINQKHYLSPFTFVQFPNIERNVSYKISCTAFNTAIKPEIGIGTVEFEILID